MATNRGGKIICVSSVKGGVGKTTITINLAGIYSLMKKKVLIIDLDLFSGGVAACLDLKNKKDIFMMIDSLSNNRFTSLNDYTKLVFKDKVNIVTPGMNKVFGDPYIITVERVITYA